MFFTYAPHELVLLEPEKFPELIHQIETQQDENTVALATVDHDLSGIETALQAEAGDKETHPELTNDMKRKAWVADQLKERGDFADLLLERADLDAKKRKLSRYHTLLLNAFRVVRARYERETTILGLGLTPDDTGHAAVAS